MTATRARPKKRTPAGRRPTRPQKRKKQALGSQLRATVAAHLGRQSDDVWGLLLMLAGALAALGIYADLTGPLGRVLRDASGAALGWGRMLFPVGLAGTGAMLVRGGPRPEPGRVVIGFGVLLVSLCGLLHLLFGAPVWGSSVTALRTAGGALGLLVAEPLRGLIAVPGASLVLLTLLGLSLLVLTRTSVRTASACLAGTARSMGSALSQA
ncbi:MAG: DNA translocase FtsK 4TM domain-containing protein, partial [Actinomycetota bacterium]|nr:DNA translocase FtsK 4TM domain-containing protein [Actinomycetota bacterium]